MYRITMSDEIRKFDDGQICTITGKFIYSGVYIEVEHNKNKWGTHIGEKAIQAIESSRSLEDFITHTKAKNIFEKYCPDDVVEYPGILLEELCRFILDNPPKNIDS